MTTKEQLLLQELCVRLLYGIKYQTYLGDVFTLKDITLSRTSTQYYIDDNAFSLSQIKPYLRSMEDMTDEELKEFYGVECIDAKVGYIKPTRNWHFTINGFDWLNKHHFDYRGLIPMGLALEAPEGMYKNKTK